MQLSVEDEEELVGVVALVPVEVAFDDAETHFEPGVGSQAWADGYRSLGVRRALKVCQRWRAGSASLLWAA